MPSCVFRKCRNYVTKVNKTQGGITYHMFPADKAYFQKWTDVVRDQRCEYDWSPSKTSRICSCHFKPTDKYISNKGRTFLKKDAVPIIERNENLNVPIFPSAIENVIVTPDFEILESPKRTPVKKSMRRLMVEKRHLWKTNKTISQQNKALKQRLAKVAFVLKDLKKKECAISEQSQLDAKTEALDRLYRLMFKNKGK